MRAWESIENVEELLQLLHNEAECHSFLFRMKWPDGYTCPRCHHGEAYVIKTRRLPLYDCRACRHQTSLIAGTIIEGSRTPLWKWLTAIWLVSRTDLTFNAVELRALIQVTYKTAWSMLHKIRKAINRADTAEPLAGEVHGIVAFYGRPYSSPILLHERECPIIVAESSRTGPAGSDAYTNPASGTEMEEESALNRRLKMKIVDRSHCSGKSLLRIASDEFAKVHTQSDSSVSIIRYYFQAKRNRYLCQTFKRVWQWMNRTYHGIGSSYLQLYLDEFCFRHNAAACGSSPWVYLLRSCLSFRDASASNTSYVISAA